MVAAALRAACAAALVAACTPLRAADGPPQAVPIRETPITAFSGAEFEFAVAGLSAPLRVKVRMAPAAPGGRPRLEAMELAFGDAHASVGPDLLSDIAAPDFLKLQATAVTLPAQDRDRDLP